ncbi:MAG: VCBS repeat-containing protein, partial [Saprospiraceae bacterium]
MKLSTCFKNLVVLLLTLLTTQCGKNSGAPDVAPAPSDALFEHLSPGATGVDFANVVEENYDNNIMTNSYLYNGGGVGVLDFNNDGLVDLYFTRTQGSCKLYQNLGNLKFKDVTEQAGVQAMEGEKTGVAIADVNADGWPDIYVCRTGMQPTDARRNLLFINNKNGTFTEMGRPFGLADGAATNQANFFDADGDGDLDCYVLNYPVN